ncbi:hypothetical protein D0Z00_001519 [Geotrichum galactomycetum]|uniref:Uncharacterized protein n=1 Tax=Geotrichum galactomycetum TaxID=27317 RepID=A0ACB6V6Q7_9ASCO|nr:hypothetical protein D0Z00_001519 [Geotrichum candidum]
MSESTMAAEPTNNAEQKAESPSAAEVVEEQKKPEEEEQQQQQQQQQEEQEPDQTQPTEAANDDTSAASADASEDNNEQTQDMLSDDDKMILDEDVTVALDASTSVPEDEGVPMDIDSPEEGTPAAADQVSTENTPADTTVNKDTEQPEADAAQASEAAEAAPESLSSKPESEETKKEDTNSQTPVVASSASGLEDNPANDESKITTTTTSDPTNKQPLNDNVGSDMELDMELSDAETSPVLSTSTNTNANTTIIPKAEYTEPSTAVAESSLVNTQTGTSATGEPAVASSATTTASDNTSATSTASAAPVVPIYRQVKAEAKPAPPTPKLAQTHAIVMPSYSAWFSLAKIHEVERRSLPEFFNKRNRSKTPEIYTKYRNFMVNTYRLNPAEYLTVTACRRNLIGDVCAIMRVHDFLDKWGIINYQVDVEALPSNVFPPFTGHWNVLFDTPRGLFPFKFYKGQDDPSANTLPGDKKLEDIKRDISGSATPADVRKEKSNEEDEKIKKKEETEKSATPGSAAAASASAGTGSKSEANSIEPGEGWTKKELLLLLEGVEKFSYDWKAISDHVGTKDKQACVLKFLSLSIEDPYLDGKSDIKGNSSSGGLRDKLGPLKYDVSNVPFSKADNPVLSVVSFLAGLSDPKVIAAAAERSIDALKETVDKKDDATKKPTKDAGDEESSFVENASKVAFGSIAARADVIKDQVTREMYTNLFKIVSLQTAKNEAKMKKFNQLEHVLDIEKRELEREREEIFLDRLALNKKVKSIEELLSKAIAKVGEANNNADTASVGNENAGSRINNSGLADEVKSLLEEADKVLGEGTRLQLSAGGPTTTAAVAVVEEEDTAAANGVSGAIANGKSDVQPISVELPQTYKYWSI